MVGVQAGSDAMQASTACFHRNLPDRRVVRGVYFRTAADFAFPRSSHRHLWTLISENFLRKDLQYPHFQGNITQTFQEVLSYMPIYNIIRIYKSRKSICSPGFSLLYGA